MEAKTRTFDKLSYLEKHIIKVIIEDYDRDEKTALDIINEYGIVLEMLDDGHESAQSFAEMFDNAYKSGNSGKTWINNMFSYLHEYLIEVRDFGDCIKNQGVSLIIRYDGISEIDGKKYVAIYVGENHPTHTVRKCHFYISPDKSVIMADDVISGNILPLAEWREVQEIRIAEYEIIRKEHLEKKVN